MVIVHNVSNVYNNVVHNNAVQQKGQDDNENVTKLCCNDHVVQISLAIVAVVVTSVLTVFLEYFLHD